MIDQETRDVASLLSALMPKRSPSFFLAWYIEENAQNGQANWKADNNPFNLSATHGEPVPDKPWFAGVTEILPNNVVVYPHAVYGVVATHLFIGAAFPHVIDAATDEEACIALGEPGAFGHWSTNPQYSQELEAILHELVTSTTHTVPGTKTVTVEAGDTLSKIAQRIGLGSDWMYLARLNHLSWPFVIDIGQVLNY